MRQMRGLRRTAFAVLATIGAVGAPGTAHADPKSSSPPPGNLGNRGTTDKHGGIAAGPDGVESTAGEKGGGQPAKPASQGPPTRPVACRFYAPIGDLDLNRLPPDRDHFGLDTADGTFFDITDGTANLVPNGTVVHRYCWYVGPDGKIPYADDPISVTNVTWPPATAQQQQEAMELVRKSIAQLPHADIVLSPKAPNPALLGMPIWLFIGNWHDVNPPPAETPNVRVQAHAHPTHTRWVFRTPGEHGKPEDTVTEDCDGPGTDYQTQHPSDRDIDRPGFCGVAIWRTTGEHDGTATITWTVTADTNLGYTLGPLTITTDTPFTYHTRGLQAVAR